MSDGAPQNATVIPHTDDSNSGGKDGATTVDQASRLEANGQSDLQEDPNPRSPKRRRLSPGKDDIEVDVEKAAARALAISLGVEQPELNATPESSGGQPNGSNSAAIQQAPGKVLPLDHQARINNLAKLDDLATQLLSTLAGMNHLEIGEMLFGPTSQRGQDYKSLKARFEQTKRAYLTNSPFASPVALGLTEVDQVDVLRKANMATFMASTFSGEIGLRIMDINFLDVFVPDGGRLLKAHGSIYLELKTQAFITAKRTAPTILNRVMLDLFPDDMDKALLQKRPGAKSLAPSETDFLKRLVSRREILYSDMRNNKLDGLQFRYRWDDFSREVHSFLVKYCDQSSVGSKEKGDQASPTPTRAQIPQNQMESQFSVVSNDYQQSNTTASAASKQFDLDFNMDDFMAQAARAAEIALQGGSHTRYAPVEVESAPPAQIPIPTAKSETNASLPLQPIIEVPQVSTPANISPVKQQDGQDLNKVIVTEFQQYKPVTIDPSSTNTSNSDDGKDGVPHQSQTAPTQVLYERARLVTTNKLSTSRKSLPPSHRRPWTNEEENALMTGLDQVKGPHWSQILAMFGPGGTINESLKDRNQVQLKDKARNLKLFFLKAGIEVPYYLQAVTGDLKTRAPAQAEKREAKERERAITEGDETFAQQDEAQTETADELDIPTRSMTDQEDNPEPTLTAYQEAAGQQQVKDEHTKVPDEDILDVEAMIARAAASATRSLGDSWP